MVPGITKRLIGSKSIASQLAHRRRSISVVFVKVRAELCTGPALLETASAIRELTPGNDVDTAVLAVWGAIAAAGCQTNLF